MPSSIPNPLLIADGDIATTQLLARVIGQARGGVEIRYPQTLVGAKVAGRSVTVSRLCMPSHAWLPGYFAKRRVEYLYLLDDNFWALTDDVDPHLAAYFGHPAVVETLDGFIRGARAAVVMSHRLGEAIRERLPGTRIEYLNPPFDTVTASRLMAASPGSLRPFDEVRIGYPTTRRPSISSLLEVVVRHVVQRFRGRVQFEFVGWMPDALAGVPGVVLYPHVPDYERYLEFALARQWDIGLAPLLEGRFEACKTSVKYREYGGCGVPGIYSRVPPYTDDVVDGRTGILAANDAAAWIDALERLIELPSLRRAIVANAREDVERNFSQRASARRWLEISTAPAPAASMAVSGE